MWRKFVIVINAEWLTHPTWQLNIQTHTSNNPSVASPGKNVKSRNQQPVNHIVHTSHVTTLVTRLSASQHFEINGDPHYTIMTGWSDVKLREAFIMFGDFRKLRWPRRPDHQTLAKTGKHGRSLLSFEKSLYSNCYQELSSVSLPLELPQKEFEWCSAPHRHYKRKRLMVTGKLNLALEERRGRRGWRKYSHFWLHQ